MHLHFPLPHGAWGLGPNRSLSGGPGAASRPPESRLRLRPQDCPRQPNIASRPTSRRLPEMAPRLT
eukprot:8280831-Pyramimonas_sp.AAC.2